MRASHNGLDFRRRKNYGKRPKFSKYSRNYEKQKGQLPDAGHSHFKHSFLENPWGEMEASIHATHSLGNSGQGNAVASFPRKEAWFKPSFLLDPWEPLITQWQMYSQVVGIDAYPPRYTM